MKQVRHLFIYAMVMLSGCSSLPTPVLTPDAPFFSVVTYNINWGAPDAYGVLESLVDVDADIVCLQETHIQWERFLKQSLKDEYPYSYFHSSGGAGGIAFLSKYPFINVTPLSSDAGWFPALLGKIKTKLGTIQILNVHLTPPVSDTAIKTVSAYSGIPNVHRKELAEFLSSADAGLPLVIAGDFNENENRAAVKHLVKNGFTDALSLYDTKTKTWSWKLFPWFTLTNRYDHALFSGHLHCTGARVIENESSDHRPVAAVFVRSSSLF